MKFECDCKDADEVAELPRMEMGRWGVRAVGKSWLVFYKGYETPALHPLSYHVSDLKDGTSPVQRIGKYMHL